VSSIPVPDWWQATLLALAAFRVYRLVARDTLTAPLRAAVTYEDDLTVELGKRPSETGLQVIGDDEQPKTWRTYLSTLIRCPWCLGAYSSAGWWVLWAQWPREALFAATPWAISAVVALLAKNLDAM
jgi:hypothetical protein